MVRMSSSWGLVMCISAMLGPKAARGAATKSRSRVLMAFLTLVARRISGRTVRLLSRWANSRATTVVVSLTGIVVNALRFHKVAQTTVCVCVVIQRIARSVEGLLPLIQADIVESIFAISVVVHEAIPIRARQTVRKHVDFIQTSGQMVNVHVKGFLHSLEVIGLKLGSVAGKKRTSELAKMAVPVGVGPVSDGDVVANAIPGGTKTAAKDAGQVRVTCTIVNVKAVIGTSLSELVENTEDAFGIRGIRGKDKILLPAMFSTCGVFVGVGKQNHAIVLKEDVRLKEDGRGLDVFSANSI